MNIGLQKFDLTSAEDNRSNLRETHLREAGLEYISRRHVGNYIFKVISTSFLWSVFFIEWENYI